MTLAQKSKCQDKHASRQLHYLQGLILTPDHNPPPQQQNH